MFALWLAHSGNSGQELHSQNYKHCAQGKLGLLRLGRYPEILLGKLEGRNVHGLSSIAWILWPAMTYPGLEGA